MLDHSRLDWGVVAVFVLVYLGMILGGLPRVKLNRSGVALLGAIAVIGLGAVSVEDAARSVELPTIAAGCGVRSCNSTFRAHAKT